MYHPDTIAETEARLLARPGFKAAFPDGIPHYSIQDSRDLAAQIERAYDEQGKPTRAWTAEEDRFIATTLLRVRYDALYFLEAFIQIDQEGHGLRPLFPLWESQQLVLDRLAALERQQKAAKSPDGLLINVLKVRQVGVTTFSVCLNLHRVVTQDHVRGLLGADIESQAGYMFRMAERAYQHLPTFLKPQKLTSTKDKEITFSNASSLKTAWGKTTRGALQEAGGTKGNIARGQTYPVVSIGELATWDYPEQLDTALLPGIPVSRSTLVIFESTAELADDWWNRHWEAAKEGTGRFHNVFVPNYAVPSKYNIPAPESWQPMETTSAWVQKAERESPQWCGRTVVPSRAQAYWYEVTRAYYQKKEDLAGFLKEYPSDDLECFQYAGTTIFTLEQHERMAQQARPLLDVWAVEPSREIAELRRQGPVQEDDTRRRPVPLSTRIPVQNLDAYPVPPGYGFRRLPPAELQALLTEGQGLRSSVMAIYEYPRTRGHRRYVMAVDVGYGLGKDYSVITVARVPTMEEPGEGVAQYISNILTPKQLAWVCDAIGHLYLDEEGIEALAAIECNLGPGLSTQDILQLHLGYHNFYVWEYANAREADRRFSTRIGWYTTNQTRPILMAEFHDAVTQVDAISGQTDYRVNSPITRAELRHLVIPPGGTIGDATAGGSHHDDCVISEAIGRYLSFRLAAGESEPIDERRRRKQALAAHQAQQGTARRVDWRNSAYTADEQKAALQGDEEPDDGDEAGVYFNDRNTDG